MNGFLPAGFTRICCSAVFLLMGLNTQAASTTPPSFELYQTDDLLPVYATNSQIYGNDLLLWRNDESVTTVERYLVNDVGTLQLQSRFRPGPAGYDPIERFGGQVQLDWVVSFRDHTLFAYQNSGLVCSRARQVKIYNREGGEVAFAAGANVERYINNSITWFAGADGKLYSFGLPPAACNADVSIPTFLIRWDFNAQGQLQVEATADYDILYPEKLRPLLPTLSQFVFSDINIPSTAYITQDRLWLVGDGCGPYPYSRSEGCVKERKLLEYRLNDMMLNTVANLEAYNSYKEVIATTAKGVLLFSPEISSVLLVNLTNAAEAKELRKDVRKVLGHDATRLHYLNLNNEVCRVIYEANAIPLCEVASEDIGNLMRVEQKNTGQYWFTDNGIYWKQNQQAARLLQRRYIPSKSPVSAGILASGQSWLVPGAGLSIAADGSVGKIHINEGNNPPCSGAVVTSSLLNYAEQRARVNFYKDCTAIDAINMVAPPSISRNQQVVEHPGETTSKNMVAVGQEMLTYKDGVPNSIGSWQRIQLDSLLKDAIYVDEATSNLLRSYKSDVWLVEHHWVFSVKDADGAKLYSLAVGDSGKQLSLLAKINADYIIAIEDYFYLFTPSELQVWQFQDNSLNKVTSLTIENSKISSSYAYLTGSSVKNNQLLLTAINDTDRVSMYKFDVKDLAAPQYQGRFEYPMSGFARDYLGFVVQVEDDGYLLHNSKNGEILRYSATKAAFKLPTELLVAANDTTQKIYPLQSADAAALQVVTAPAEGTLDIRSDGLYFTRKQQFDSSAVVLSYKDTAGHLTEFNLSLKAKEIAPADVFEFTLSEPLLAKPVLLLVEDTALIVSDVIKDGTKWQWAIAEQSKSVLAQLKATELTLTPASNFNGEDKLMLVLTSVVGSRIFPITIKVQAVNDAPVFTKNAAIGVTVGEVASEQVMATDVDGDALTFKLGIVPSKGTATMQPDGKFSFAATAAGADRFTIVVTDAAGASSESEVLVQIKEAVKVGTSGGASWFLLLLAAASMLGRASSQLPTGFVSRRNGYKQRSRC